MDAQPTIPSSRITPTTRGERLLTSLRQSGPYLFLLILAFAANGLICHMSPFQSHLYACDACSFYTDGMALANGMIPYVDFIDVKGPLLFIIYMIGYLLHPNGMWGIYLILSLATFLSYLALYKLAILFLKNRLQALLVISLLTLILFHPYFFSYGGRTESILMPLIVWPFYLLVRHYHPEYPKDERSYGHLAYYLSVSAVICLMIKYSYTIFPLAALGLIAIELLLMHRPWLRSFILKTVCTALLMTLPFLLYLTLVDAWGGFCQYYLVFAVQQSPISFDYGEMNPIVYRVLSLWGAFKRLCLCSFWEVFALLSPLCLPAYLFYKRYSIISITIITLPVLLLEALLILSPFSYYRLLLLPFSIFSLIIFIHLLSRIHCRWVLPFSFLAANALWFTCDYLIPREEFHQLMSDVNSVRETNKALQILDQHPNSTILYLGNLDLGFGISSGALPAVPLWSQLNYSTQQMIEANRQGVIDRTADYVIAYDKTPHIQLLQKHGYIRAASFREISMFGTRDAPHFSLWAKSQDLILPPSGDSLPETQASQFCQQPKQE